MSEGTPPVGPDRVAVSTAASDPEWDAFVDAVPGGHHLQSSLWGQVKAPYGWSPVRLALRRGAELRGGMQLLVRQLPAGSLGYCPRGPLIAEGGLASFQSLLNALAAEARRRRILYVKLQPPVDRADLERQLPGLGFVRSDQATAPVASVRIDLRREPEQILAAMRPTARANIRKAERRGVTVREAGVGGLSAFGELLAATSHRQGFAPYPLGYYAAMLERFGPKAELLLAEHDGEALSGALIIGYGDTVIYKMGAWSGKRTSIHPNELMHWQAMWWARERGYCYYDLEGIRETTARAVLAGGAPPPREMEGLTRFKLALGGEVMLYPASYDRSFHRLLTWPARVATPRLSRFQVLAHRLQGRAVAQTFRRHGP